LMETAFPDLHQDSAAHLHKPRTAESLSPLQLQALEAIVATDEAWNPSWGIDFALKCLGLPGPRRELRTFLETTQR